MIALALRSLGQRKLRTALTGLAVLLGVAMIAGTYVQTDRIRGAFESLTQTVNRGTDVVVSPRESFAGDLGAPTQGLDESLLTRVRDVPGVRLAQGQLDESGALVIGGEAVSSGFAPSVVASYSPEPFDAFRYVKGRPPRRPGEVVVDRQLAEDQGLRVGQRVGLSTRSGVQAPRSWCRSSPTFSAGSSAPVTCRASRSPPSAAWRRRSSQPRFAPCCPAR